MQNIVCAECGNALPVTALFCDMCGTAVQNPQLRDKHIIEEKAIKALFLPENQDTTPPEPAASLGEDPATTDGEAQAVPVSPSARSLYTRPRTNLAARPGRTPSQDADRISRRDALGCLGTLGGLLCGLAIAFMDRRNSFQGNTFDVPTFAPPPDITTYSGHTGPVVAAVWSPDGTSIASGSQDKTVQVWEVTTGRQLLAYRGHTDQIISVAWSPTGGTIASTSSDGTLQIWNATSGERVATAKSSSVLGLFLDIAWSPDGKLIAVGSADNRVSVWDASLTTRLVSYTGHTESATGVAWSPDGTRLASSGSYDKTVQICALPSGQKTLTYTSSANFVGVLAWSPDAKYIASGEGSSDYTKGVTITVWDATTGQALTTYTGHYNSITGLVWSHDSLCLASSSADGTVQVWKASNGSRLFTYSGHAAPVNSVAWSPDDQLIASGGSDNSVQVWKVTG